MLRQQYISFSRTLEVSTGLSLPVKILISEGVPIWKGLENLALRVKKH